MKKSLSIIGVGAFGEFMLKHVTPYFETKVHDAMRDLSDIVTAYNVEACSLEEAAQSDIVVLAIPVRSIEGVLMQIKDKFKIGQLIIDVASVKVMPSAILSKHVPQGVDAVSLHPLFGPQSGKNGIHGLNIAVINVQGDRNQCIADFLSAKLGLNVIHCTAEEHDRQMAYVQGLTHMIAKVFQRMQVPPITQATTTFSLLQQMVDIVKNDSDALFRAIQTDNPFVEETKMKFFDCVRTLESDLKH